MVRSLFLALGLVFGGCAFAQDDPPLPPDGPGIDDARIETLPLEVMPEFPGGEAALAAFIKKEVKYPKKAKRAGIEGQVVIRFVVDKDGSVSDAKVAKGVDPLLDAEALRAVQAMPKWTPGKLNGKPVKVQFNLPVRFRLQD
jgi:protein TonB